MPTAYVILAEEDRPFIEKFVLPVLPSNGYDRWLSRDHLASATLPHPAMAHAVDQCELILAVLSPASIGSTAVVEEIGIALKSRRTLIAVQVAELNARDASSLPNVLWAALRLDFTVEEEGEALALLTALLPLVDAESEGAITPEHAERIEWNEEIFSASLLKATKRHDHARAESLVRTIVGHLASRPYPYPPKQASANLQELRQELEFELMSRYGDAVIASGTRQDKVRRLFAQALIETKEYGRALDVLHSIIDDKESSENEVFEAYGLIGRTFKQRYLEAPGGQAADLIRSAIAAYQSVFAQDPNQCWHGVNAASCILRAQRDGIDAAPPGRAQEIARQVVEVLDKRERAGGLEVWDCASRVEALLALERYDDAERALEVYINHPDMRAFEVSSTFRQFDQVLELGRHARGAAILARLRGAVERYRAGGLATTVERMRSGAAESLSEAPRTIPLIIRLRDSAWTPGAVADFVIQTRLGRIITARGSEATVRELLTDSRVISVEESRPAGNIECERSVPFIRITPEYASAAGNYKETGDRVLIAIIDNGIDVLHKAFVDADGNSRILGIWDQNDSTGPPPEGFTYGTFHDDAAIAGYLKAKKVPPGLGRNKEGHGTHVASIAAGRAAGAFAGGVAPDAKLLIVVSGGSGPIGYSQSHIEALAFIDTFAAERKLPVVVNLSQGMNAGAHDGKSPLEVAFDAFSNSGTRPGRVVVKSAGNEREKKGHARVTLRPNARERLRWSRIADAGSTERIELWWSSADEMEFRLRDPSEEWSTPVGTATPELGGTFAKGGPFHLVFTKRHIDNGDSLLLIELGSATTGAALGEWLLEITSTVVPEGGEIHCWIERSGGVPTAFLDHASEDMTLSVPGTASSVIAVGAVDARNPIEVGPFSSYGPTRDQQKKPLVCAPGVDVRAARGGTANDVLVESGTSMAAPHVTGAIALLLSRMAKSGKIPSGTQIASALRQKTQNYNGCWDRGQGYGVIDVGALLGAF